MEEYIVNEIIHTHELFGRKTTSKTFEVYRIEKDYQILEKEYDLMDEVEAYVILKNGIIVDFKKYETLKA